MHQNKGKTIARCLKDRTDYAKNGEKTDHGELIYSYACDKETVDQEFLLAKQEYYRITGRKPNGDIIAYQIRQSSKPLYQEFLLPATFYFIIVQNYRYD